MTIDEFMAGVAPMMRKGWTWRADDHSTQCPTARF